MAEKSLKETKVLKTVKTIVGGMAAIGGAALAGAALKKVDTKTIKGISKIFIPVGILGLSHAAGEIARKGSEGSIDDTIDIAEMFIDTSDIVETLEPSEDFDDDIEVFSDDEE